jgi:hypothetical protein
VCLGTSQELQSRDSVLPAVPRCLFKSQVPNELIPIDPLGQSVTYFREDEAFK